MSGRPILCLLMVQIIRLVLVKLRIEGKKKMEVTFWYTADGKGRGEEVQDYPNRGNQISE